MGRKIWQSTTMTNYLLSVSYDDNGDMIPEIRAINSRKNELFPLFANRVKLPEYVYERIALTKLLRGTREEGEFGWWVGPNHMLVALSKDEFNALKSYRIEPRHLSSVTKSQTELANVNARKQSKDPR
jgi:hypothetical protein